MHGKTIAMFLLLFSNLHALSQNDSTFFHRVDSLKSGLLGSVGQIRYDILDRLANEYLTVADSIALSYATEAFNISWRFGDSLRIVKSGRVKVMILEQLDEYDTMITLSAVILPIARRNSYIREIRYLLNLVGVAYTFKAEYDKALAYNLESLELRKNDDKLSVSIALNNTGLVYYKMKDYSRALEFFERVLELRRELLPNLDRRYYVRCLTNIALCHLYMNNLTQAENFIKETYNSCQGNCMDYDMMGTHYSSGLLYFKRGNMQLATRKFLESLMLARKISDQRFQLDNLILLSEIGIKTNRLVEAENYLLQAEPLFENAPFNLELIKVYSQLFQLYSRLGNYRKVAHYQNKYIQLKDSTVNEHLATNLMKVEAEYQERENKTKLEAQAKILKLSNDLISRQRALNIVLVIVAILSIAFVIVLVQNNKQKKRANISLEQKVKERTLQLEANHDELLKSLSERDLQMKRISADIKSSMATIKGLCKLSLQDSSVVNAGQYITKIEKASDSLQSGIHRTLGISESVAS